MREFCVLWLLLLLPSYSGAMEKDEMDLETLLVGIKHHDALLQSAQGTLEWWYYVSDYAKQVDPLAPDEVYGEGKWEVAFAFDSSRIRCDVRSEIFSNDVRIWDGEKLIEINYAVSPPGIAVRGSMEIENSSLPRYWETYNDRTDEGVSSLGQYLEQHQCQLAGRETFQGVFCYVVSTKISSITTAKFWVAPSKGYRMVKYEAIIRTEDTPARVVGITDYLEVKDGIWFPKSGTRTFYRWDKVPKKERLLNKTTMKLKTVKVNVDVSEQFNLNLSPESEVWDHRTQSICTLKQVWP